MPKLKTHRGAAKRIKRTKNGKYKCHKARKRHLLEAKPPKRKRQARAATFVHKANEYQVKRLLPYA